MKEDTDNWEAHWKRYNKSAQLNPAQAYRQQLLLSILKKGHCEKLLDIGSGQGDFLWKVSLALPQTKLCGFELSTTGVQIAKEKVPKAEVHVIDILKPSKQSKQFINWATHVTCSEVLEHIDSPVEFLKASSRYLCKNGSLLITVPSGPISEYDKHIGHRQHFTKSTIQQVMVDAGFSPTKVSLAGFPFFNLYRLLVILRGRQLILDADTSTRQMGLPLKIVMRIFSQIFSLNLPDSKYGWQIIAQGRKT